MTHFSEMFDIIPNKKFCEKKNFKKTFYTYNLMFIIKRKYFIFFFKYYSLLCTF